MENLDDGIAMETICKLESLSLDIIYVEPNAVESCVYHKSFDEVLYVLQGEIEVFVEKQTIRCKKGQCAIVPKMSRHIVNNIGEGTARVLAICSPQYSAKETCIC